MAGRPLAEPKKSASALALVRAPNKLDIEVEDGDACRQYRARVERSAVEVSALQQEVGGGRSLAENAELRPEPTPTNRHVKVENPLALDQVSGSDEVVARREGRQLDGLAKLFEHRRNTTASLMDIDNDRRHTATVAADLCRKCV